jgi:2,3-bisphosphoglycerate-dependent phosphoglycerate mutase
LTSTVAALALDLEPTRVVLIRHGQTAWNVAMRIQGHTDEPLNEHGLWQAAQTAQVLADERLGAIYTSDLLRARATALALSRHAGVAPVDVLALRERHFGSFEGATFAEVDQRWPQAALRWRQRDVDFAPPGGETLAQFAQRVVPAAAALAARHAGQCIAIVSHGGVLDCLYRAAVGLPLNAPRSWQLGNASINRLLYTGSGFTLVGWSDDAHLMT